MTRSLIVGLVAFTAGALCLSAQQATYRAATDTVSLYATVVDRTGRLVTDLAKEDFQILDDGNPQDLTIFKNDIQPITIVIMLDRSGSMVGNFTIVRRAAEQFVSNLLPADKAKLGSFSNRIEIDPTDFTSDVNELIRILHYDLQGAGPTPLWNATSAAMNALGRQDGRRVVLLFTDGYDSPGRSTGNVTLRDVVNRSQTEEVMVYAIGLADACGVAPQSSLMPHREVRLQRGGRGRYPGPMGTPPGRGFGRGRMGCPGGSGPDPGLKVLADEGGGGYFELHGTDDLTATFARVADELHHQYLLGFTTPHLDGKLHKLEVRLRDRDLTARARKSYLAPSGK
jgi:Ca-activated chloride channel homolog